MQQHSISYTFLFSAAICGVCAIFVSSSAVSLEDLQDANVELFRKRNVLEASGVVTSDEILAPAEVEERFANFEPVVIDLRTSEEDASFETSTFDQQKIKKDPATSTVAPNNTARVKRMPNHALIYKGKNDAGEVEVLVLPIEGYGLWSTLYGFVAIDADTNTIRGLAYYDQKETAGLGGEVDNPRWKALWPGRKIFDDSWKAKIEVIKGSAGPVAEDPYRVDGLAGATITSRGVTNMLHYWMGENGFGPYLEKFRKGAV